MANSQFINVSGSPSFEEQRVTFGSGIFGVDINAELAGFNATFGFNETPHNFTLEMIPLEFADETLPPIGSGVQLTISNNFLIQGRIKHSDFNKSDKGNTVTVVIEDIRTDLNNIYLDTYGLFGSTDSPSINVVDVRYWYIKNFVETNDRGRSRIIRDLNLLDNHGASYRQIYEAIKYFEEQVGTINDILNKIPKPEVVESQLPLDPDGYRWQFRSQPLLECLARILGDVSFDFYWNMHDKQINVINRKYVVNIDRNNIPVPGDTAPITSLRYGKDEAERATSVRIYGAQMEGLIGSVGRLKTESGAYGLASGIYDLGITPFALPSGAPIFVPGWRNAKIKFFGPDGSIREDIPTDRELKAALKSIEYWAMEKDLENRIDASTIQQDGGTTDGQASLASISGLGFIANRGQPGRSWVLEWYNRVRNFAQNHFGRTYILSKTSPLYDEIDNLDILDAAWCNIENQTDDGSYEDNYKIKEKFKFLAPFWVHDSNKMRAWASFPIEVDDRDGIPILRTPKWGTDGKGVPAQYEDWNEDEDMQYVPIEVRKWTQAENLFQDEFLEPLFNDEKGILIKLPNTCWKEYDSLPDPQLLEKPILNFINGSFTSLTQQDIITDPLSLGEVYEEISEVSIPIRVKRRYGFAWPSVWASGSGVDFEVQVRDEFAPWEYEPRGSKQSWQLMEDEALSVLSSRVVSRNEVTFAEVQKIGLPIISFDSFANQTITPQGYGIISHGVTNLNVTKNLGWWQTKYSLKSHFPQLIKAKPVPDQTEEDFRFVIKRLEQMIPPTPIQPFIPIPTFDREINDGRRLFVQTNKNTLTIPVTITQIIDADTENPAYVGKDDVGTVWPAAFRQGLNLDPSSEAFQNRKAFATDGFLQIGMRAVYNYQDQEDGSYIHYFTGGISLSTGRVVELLESPRLVQGIYRASIRTVPETVVDIEGNPFVVNSFRINNVPFLNQQAVDTSLESGDKIFLSGTGNENNTIKPGFDVSTGNSQGVGKDSLHLVNSSVPSTVGSAIVTKRPDTITGLGGQVRTISTSGGQTIADGQVIGNTKFNVRFIGTEFELVAIGDPCITIQEREQGAEGEVRLYCFIIKPTFGPWSASGPGFIN